MGYDEYDFDKDVEYTPGDNTFRVDVERTEQKSLAGGGVEFGSGAEGVGVGAVGGVVIIYTMVSTGEGPSSSGSTVVGVYRLLPSVAGGM